ncbi:uncharacterized protein LOC125230528 [Leguminivora glycinivorella]|uniref:uncharacterized protein LOC125230528 n=1 Tax=Leguminivora glycinivorella TaxID=1035111 RepID=UPI00200ED5B8|nr:uncharacterized protein LOC125230528 [Leguminivora glycinivorella]
MWDQWRVRSGDMRACGTLLLALLLAGINGSDIEPQLFEKGNFVEITIVTFPNTVSKCYLVTPWNTNIDLLASDTLSEKYEYLPNTISACRVRINDLVKNDEGLWSLHANISEDGEVNELKEQVYVTIRGNDASNETVNSEETVTSEENSKLSAEEATISKETSEDNKSASSENSEVTSQESSEASSSEEKKAVETQWLSDLQFRTRTGLDVDINFPKIMKSEKCILTKPDGTTVDVEEVIAGVTVHSSSHYVSCRVVVGPMDETLLGKWTLCGYYEENDVEHRRCQNAEIIWRSTANPGSVWQTTINPRFNHVVSFGGTLSPAVRGSGSVVSCHVVTPDDEDLFVTRDREYPDVKLAQDTDSVCSIAIGPIAEQHLANWTVYGTFDSALWSYNEVRQPINMALYDENNPYDQPYNVTTLNPTQHVVNLGSTLPVEVTGTGAVDVCQFTTPAGQIYLSTGSLPAGTEFVALNRIACRLSIGPITADMIGDWQLIGKFSNRNVHTENRLSFTIVQEDPSNPIEEDRTVENLNEQFIDTSIGASHRVVIASDIFTSFESCHIRTPEGLQYTIMEGFHIPGVEVVTTSNVNCGVTIDVSEDLIGNWTLISREVRSSVAIEKRLPFIIYVEEPVEAVINEITITEGNSIHVRLSNPTELYDTCRLTDPNDEELASVIVDENHKETCGFVVPSVDANHAGIWNIVHGKTIVYKAPVLVHVNARENLDTSHITLVEHSSVNETIGPEEAVYCKVMSPDGNVVFDRFGRCQLTLNRVLKDQHEGGWTLLVGMPGRIVTERYSLLVSVTAADTKPEVSSHVSVNKPTVELTCSVKTSQQITGCLFRGPAAAEVLVANPGVSEGPYVFHVNQTSTESEYYYTCSLQITEPVTSDLGPWRCDLESEEENYYGFLTVLCPWALKDSVIAESVMTVPVLSAQASMLSVEEREPVTLACAARAPLRYCYFRAPNGTVFNVGPEMSSPTMEYVGAGLDAGECGVRFQSLLHSDAGEWSCHASIDRQEQNQTIYVDIKEEMRVSSKIQYDSVVIEGQVAWNRELEYCRFVRFDGFGFSSIDHVKSPYYQDESSSSRGICRMRVASTPENLQPWTVVAKLQGRDGEISRLAALSWPGPEPTPRYYNAIFLWLPILTIFIGCMLLGAAPSKNRRWAAERASILRASMRDSMRRFPSWRKKPLTDTSNTSPAA